MTSTQFQVNVYMISNRSTPDHDSSALQTASDGQIGGNSDKDTLGGIYPNLVSRSQTKYSVSFLTEGGTTLHIWSDFDGRPEPSLGLSVLMDLKTTVGKSAEPNVVVCP